MESLSTFWLSVILFVLILASAFFSASETSMMAINRYRLKHLVKTRNKSASRVSKLLQRTDRLLGLILIGNNFTHTLATAIATVIAIRIWDDNAVLAVTVFMTIVMIIFAEVMPKTIAALKPESIAFPASYILKPLSKLFSPLVTLVSLVSNNVTKLIGIDLEERVNEDLKPEELKTLLETSGVPEHQQKMLIGILEMDYLSVNDVMVPRNKITGIDLDDPLEVILKDLQETEFTYIPFFKDSIDNVIGFLTVNRKADFFSGDTIDLKSLLNELEEPVFIPENTPLNKQLATFQSVDTRVGLIVDEYGDIDRSASARAPLGQEYARSPRAGCALRASSAKAPRLVVPVSYTHLTLPTKRIV